MPLRDLFTHFSERLLADYERTKSINHLGGRGSSREELFREFLAGHLPRKYAVGAGEIVSSRNQRSRQCDLVIYDDISFPRLFASGVHSIFPLESVYGVVEVKSDLTSDRLAEAYEVIASVKRLSRYPDMFTVDNGTTSSFVKYPVPVGIVLAFSAGRSLDAIADQARALDNGLTERYFRPDFIAVLGEGVIGPTRQMRGARNEISIEIFNDTWTISRTLQHTLLRAYMQMTGDLGAVELQKLDLWDYLIMPDQMGKHRVKHNLVVRDGKGTRLTAEAVARVMSDARRRPSTFGDVYKVAHGRLPSWLGYEQDKEPLWLFAPSLDHATEAKPAWPLAQDPTFDSPNLFLFEVDDEMHVVELSALTPADWEEVMDPGFVSFFV